jgi:hopene-associated glycosyltransferase HpnB
MSGIELSIIVLSLVSLVIWIGLLSVWGQFWRTDQQLELEEAKLKKLPAVCAVIPARNEADLLPITLRSLLTQDYAGAFTVFLVDDNSTDGTTQVAKETAQSLAKEQQLHIVAAKPLPSGWTGKLWAMEQGIQAVETLYTTSPEQSPEYLLLTDADIKHDTANLQRLVAKAVQEDLDLASIMVKLRCESFWEQLLIPAFVFFFQKLYPFHWVNDPTKATAAAAGGCILIRRQALARIGGIQVVRQALIDDCALAEAVKSGVQGEGVMNSSQSDHKEGRIWLGLSTLTQSLRPYPDLDTIWNMVARTAFTQLNYSPFMLLGALIGMTLVYLVPPIGAILGVLTGNWPLTAIGFTTWLLMTLAYLPTIRFYQCSLWLACCLPVIAFLYTLMTLDSALRHWQGRGGAWKGRVYSSS